MPLPDAEAAGAARGWLARRTAPNPSTTSSETFVTFRSSAVPPPGTSSSIEARVPERPAAIDRLLAAAAVPPPDADAAEAARGWLIRRAAPVPSSTSLETFVTSLSREAVANNLPILSFPRQKIGKKADCRIGGMLESPPAPSPRGFSTSPVAPAAQDSPSLSASLPSTGESRAVVDAGRASLPSTGRSRAVADAVVASLPAAVEPRAKVDASSSSSSPTGSLVSGDAESVEPPSTGSSSCGSSPSGGLFRPGPINPSSSLSGASSTLWRGMGGKGGRPTRSRKRAAMLLTRRVFSERITRLSASKLFAQRPHSPGSQLRQGRPALAQEQLREEQVAPTAQKQQRSCRATSVFRRLLPPSLAGGAIVTDEE